MIGFLLLLFKCFVFINEFEFIMVMLFYKVFGFRFFVFVFGWVRNIKVGLNFSIVEVDKSVMCFGVAVIGVLLMNFSVIGVGDGYIWGRMNF